MGGHPTPTPFQPLHPTAVVDPAGGDPASPGGFFQPTWDYFGIDFSNQRQRVSVQIDPSSSQVNRGNTVSLTFIPGNSCQYSDHRACVSAYHNGTSNLIFITVHSGVGGEGQAFRHALEGTGLNRAGYDLGRVQANMEALSGAEAAVVQGDGYLDGLTLVAVSRIPPAHVSRYLALPIQDAIDYAAQLDSNLAAAIDPSRPVLAFETCGWRMPGEAWYPGISATTGSIYLGVIQNLP